MKIINDLKKLRQVSVPLETIEEEDLEKMIKEMREVMIKNLGIGLAAPQVGIFKRIFLMYIDNGSIETVINPEIIKSYWQENYMEEGCLSFPDKIVTMGRSKKITVQYITMRDGQMEEIETELDGMSAKIFQHEIDHLNGVSII